MYKALARNKDDGKLYSLIANPWRGRVDPAVAMVYELDKWNEARLNSYLFIFKNEESARSAEIDIRGYDRLSFELYKCEVDVFYNGLHYATPDCINNEEAFVQFWSTFNPLEQKECEWGHCKKLRLLERII